MRADHFTFTAEDWTPLFVYRWLPDNPDETKAVVHIAHGLAEHGGRYTRLAEWLTGHGYAVYCNDHRGHGQSVLKSEDLGHFADADGWNLLAHDLAQMCIEEKQAYEGLPIILLGHSMGALLAQRMVYEYPDLFDAVAMSGPNGKLDPLVNVGKLIAKFERTRLGARGRSKLINQLSFGGFNKHFPHAVTPFDWLSRDAQEVARYVNDAKCGFIATTQSWVDMLIGLPALHDPANHARIRRDLPLYLFGGHRDPVNDFGNGLERLVETYRNAGVRSIRHRLYPDARHEVFNETNRAEVFHDLLEWLDLIRVQVGEKILAS
jgi:alpha-beta hydrolase superfamily lysophospholipase